jgi:large subunit ribosomal protein L3
MTHLTIIDNSAKSDTKGTEISCPATIIECPPLKPFSVRFYKNTIDGLKLISEVLSEKVDKELKRKVSLPKKPHRKIDDIKEFDAIRLVVYTQPKLTGIGKKKPEIFEIALDGKKEDIIKWCKENLDKDISIKDVFKEGQQLDVSAITKGKGFQGPVKRFGISLKRKKSEKGRRAPGSLGGWRSQGHVMYRVAHAGQTGYHQRIELNKWLLKIGNDKDITPDSGFTSYGVVKNQYIIVKGSIPGPKKRMVILTNPRKHNRIIPKEAPVIKYVGTKK